MKFSQSWALETDYVGDILVFWIFFLDMGSASELHTQDMV